MTCANACRCSFNPLKFGVITTWFAAVRFRTVTPTSGVVTNTEGFRESWNLSGISVHSSLTISSYMWNISTLATNYLVSHNFKWRTSRGRGQNSTSFRCGGALGSVDAHSNIMSIQHLLASMIVFTMFWTYRLSFWQIETRPCGKTKPSHILALFTPILAKFIYLSKRIIAPAMHLFINQ